MQINNNQNIAENSIAYDEKLKKSGGGEQQIAVLKKEIERLQHKRANPVVVGEVRDESGSRPDIARASANNVSTKIRAEVDQKIQRLQMKIQQLQGQNTGNSEVAEQQNISNKNENQSIKIEELMSMGENGQFVDERI